MNVFDTSRNGDGWSEGCGARSHGGAVCWGMFLVEISRRVGDVGVERSSEEVKIGDKMAKNDGEDVEGVRGDEG